MDVDEDEGGSGVDFLSGLDDLAEVDPADPTFEGQVQEALTAFAGRSRTVDEGEIERANESGGSGSARQYNRDAKGTTTGGQFTAGSAQSSRTPLSSGRTYTPQSKGGGSSKTPTAPAASSKFTTLAPGADNSPEAVAQMQQLLTALGFGNLTSGTYDKQTEAAVSAVQQRLGIKPNGKANKSLINKMLNAFDLSPCIKRSDDGPVMQIERRNSGDPADPTGAEVDDEELDDEALRAAIDGDELQAYWTRGKGLKRWSLNPHPWTRLRNLLRKHPGVHDAEGLASHYFHVVFGFWPGHRKGSNPVGPG